MTAAKIRGPKASKVVKEAHAQLDVRLPEGKGAPHRHLDLLLDEVHPCHHLGHRVLYL